MIEVKFLMNYQQVKETLNRIGIPNKRKYNALSPSCLAIVDPNDTTRGWIAHFKELFGLEGKPSNMDDTDKARCIAIVSMLEKWGLIEVVSQLSNQYVGDTSHAKFKIVKHKDKHNWEIINKYKLTPRKEEWLASKIKELYY